MTHAERLAKALAALEDKNLLVVTGAGISLASGIPTFRGADPDAVWKKDVTELGTHRYFREDPAGSWEWYMGRFSILEDAAIVPNAGHRALVQLERWQLDRGSFTLITQNVDTLHEQAGSRALIKVHGTADRVRCGREGCVHGAPRGSLPRDRFDMTAFRDDPCEANVPRCPECGDFLRQHVLWFDEHYQGHADYQWERVIDAVARADLVLFVGTSLAVGVTDMVIRASAQRGVSCYTIDPGPAPEPYVIATVRAGGLLAHELYPIHHLEAKSEDLLPEVLALLDAD